MIVDRPLVALQARQQALLLVRLPRLVRWEGLAVAAVLATGLVVWQWDRLAEPETALWIVRGAALLLVVGVLPFLDDPAAGPVGGSPLPLSRRAAPRLLAAATVVLGAVAALGAVGSVGGPVQRGLALECAAVFTAAAAATLRLTTRHDVPDASLPVGATTLALALCLPLLPARWALVVEDGPLWAPSHARWTLLLVLGGAALGWACRDPATGRRTRVWPRSHSRSAPAGQHRHATPLA